MRAAALLHVVAVVACSATWGCRSSKAIADLTEIHGSADRDFATKPETWQTASVGASFSLGDALRTSSQSSAMVHLAQGGGLRLGATSLVRFRSGPTRGAMRVAVEQGDAELEIGDEPLEVDTSSGAARLGKGSRVRIRFVDGKTRFDILFGQTILEAADGGIRKTLTKGDRLTIDIGGAVIESDLSMPGDNVDGGSATAQVGTVIDAGASPTTPAGPDTTALASDGDNPKDNAKDTTGTRADATPIDPLPSHIDLSIPAGESPTLHDPGAPAIVRIQFGSGCPGEGDIELVGRSGKGSKVRGMGSAAIAVAPGSTRYRLRCADDSTVRASGSIRLTKDSGAIRPPAKAPRNTIDADGRKYTVLYQNLLPEITLRWPASQGASFTLHFEGRGTAPPPQSAASFVFKSGQLPEGTYQFWVGGDGGKRSPSTTLKIGFDNAAPAAQVQEPPAKASLSGAPVTVAGVSLEGASVSVSGVDIPLDNQNRFRGEGAPRAGESALAIRIAHPKSGVHYYLRRLEGSAP